MINTNAVHITTMHQWDATIVGQSSRPAASGPYATPVAFGSHRGVTVCDRTPSFAVPTWLATSNGIKKDPSQRERST